MPYLKSTAPSPHSAMAGTEAIEPFLLSPPHGPVGRRLGVHPLSARVKGEEISGGPGVTGVCGHVDVALGWSVWEDHEAHDATGHELPEPPALPAPPSLPTLAGGVR